MNVVCVDKLSDHREMVDLDISELSLTEEIPIPEATLLLAERELGHGLVVNGAWSGWWSSLTFPLAVLDEAPDDGRVVTVEQAERVAKYLSRHTLVARKPYDAAVASITRILDPSVDITYDPDEFEALYGFREVKKIVDVRPGRVDPGDLTTDRMLFESDDEYNKRLSDILADYYLIFETYKKLGVPVED